MLAKDVIRKFHALAGWDTHKQTITGGATWPDLLEATAELLSLPLSTVQAWHDPVGPVHGNDKPVNDMDLTELIKKFKGMGMAWSSASARAILATLPRWRSRTGRRYTTSSTLS